MYLQQQKITKPGSYKVPYLNGKYIIPFIVLIMIFINLKYNRLFWIDYFNYTGENTIRETMEKLPMFLFIVTCVGITLLSYRRNLSVIPVLGLLSCLFLMTKLGYTNWIRFLIWLGIGLTVYFAFSRKNSKLNNL